MEELSGAKTKSDVMKQVSTYLTIFFILISFSTKANLDSLQIQISETTDGEEKFELAYQYARQNFFSNPDSVHEIIHFVFKDSARFPEAVSLAKCLNLYAVKVNYEGKFDSTIYYAQKSQRIFQRASDPLAWMPINMMGLANRSKGEYNQALTYFHAALEINKERKDTIQIASQLNDIGTTYTILKNYDESIRYQREALAYLTHIYNPALLGNIYNAMGINYLNLGERDSARYYYEQSLEYKKLGNNRYSLSNTLSNLCELLDVSENEEECLDCFLELLEMQRELGATDKIALTQINIAIAYRRMEECNDATAWLDSARMSLNTSADLYLFRNLYTQYAHVLQECGAYQKALLYTDSLLALNDSIYETERQKAITEFDIKYQAERKDEQIQLLSLENSNKTLQIKNQRLYISLLAVFLISLLSISIFFVLYIRQKQIKKKEIELVKMREAERIRIARDMHDEIGSGLTRISFYSEQLKTKANILPDNATGLIKKIISDSRQLSRNIKEIIWAVDPANDKLSELVYYLRDYCSDFCDQLEVAGQLEFSDTFTDIEISSQVRRNLFLMVKESLNNCAKYAKAKKIQVKCIVEDTTLQLWIADDGVGFDPETVKPGMGLSNIKNRCAALGGTYTLTSGVGHGTKIELKNLQLITTKG